jgi:hypothetical protein
MALIGALTLGPSPALHALSVAVTLNCRPVRRAGNGGG